MSLLPIQDGTVISTIAPIKMRSNKPSMYRLMKKKSGELVLQGAFLWQEGCNTSGYDWEDLPTEVEL